MLTNDQRERIERMAAHKEGQVKIRTEGQLPADREKGELSALRAALEEIDNWRAAYPGVRPRPGATTKREAARLALGGEEG